MPLVGNNEHTVVPGVYRSAQLSGSRLEDYLKDKDLDHYINLRGNFEGVEEEKVICEKYNVKYHLFKFSAKDYPEKDQILGLVELFTQIKDDGEKFAFHCKAGADRASFAEAVWHVVNNRPVKESIEDSYSIWYAHIEWNDFEKPKEFLKMYEPFQGKKSLKDWIVEDYMKP